MPDLVARLRYCAETFGICTEDEMAGAMEEAADKLEAMRAEIERLRNALAQARQVLGAYQPDSAPTFYMEAIWEADEALNLNRERG